MFHVGDIAWRSFFANDESGCYSEPHKVRIVSVRESQCAVNEKTSYGWSPWIVLENVRNLFMTERDAWLHLAEESRDESQTVIFQRRADLCKQTEATK